MMNGAGESAGVIKTIWLKCHFENAKCFLNIGLLKKKKN